MTNPISAFLGHLELDSLVERESFPVVDAFATLASELDAVHSRRKALALYAWPAVAFEEFDDDYVGLLAGALERGLSVLQQPDLSTPRVPIVRVYVLHPEDAWRVFAHTALLDVYAKGARWSHEAEELEGYLLGYTESERAAWRAYTDRRRLGWRGRTVHS